MQKENHLKNILLINLAMLCVSTSGALGKYISMPPPLTIWWRAVFAAFFLGLFCLLKKSKIKFDVKRYGKVFFVTGILMGVHWITYFFALQWSNVTIGMLSVLTYPAMTALLEPLILKTKFQKHHLWLSLMVLVGIFFLAPEFDFNNSMTQGLLIGLISAFSYSIRNILLKTQVQTFNGSVLMFYQMMIIIIFFSPILFYYDNISSTSQFPFLIFLGLITTSVGHTLFLNSFKHFSVSTASIMSSMQPIYGIIIAMIFLSEIPTGRSLIGGLLILLTVVIESTNQTKRTT